MTSDAPADSIEPHLESGPGPYSEPPPADGPEASQPPAPPVEQNTSSTSMPSPPGASNQASASAPPPGPPPIAEHICVSVSVGALLVAVDVVLASITHDAVTTRALDRIVAGLHLLAMTLPPAILVGVGFGTVVHIVRRTPWLAELRRFGTRSGLREPAPETVASGLALLAVVGSSWFILSRAAHHFATRYHDAVLASRAMGAVGVGLLLLAPLAVAILAVPLRLVTRRLGRLASRRVLLALIALSCVGLTAFVLLRFPTLLQAYGAPVVGYVLGVPLAYALLVWIRRWRFAKRPRPRRTRRVAGTLCVGAAISILMSGWTYGHRNRVRAVVEHHTILGRRLVRGYLDATDRDSDGHAFAFGGGDCDDSNPNVHPGAADPAGDGVDADCFDGDGSREVADLGDGRYGEVPRGHPNIVLISIDALRPDHLGCFGYERPVSPRIDAFCEESVRFPETIAQSSRSIRSMPAFFTGRYPSQVAFGEEYLWPTLLAENETFAETLRRGGYATAVTMGTNYFERVRLFFQGFEQARQLEAYRPARDATVDSAIRQLDRLRAGRRPFMLWLHLFNVHERYLWDRTPSRFGGELVDAYDTEISLADVEVGRMLDALAARELDQETIVILASDHGEAFGERGHSGHSQSLYQEEILATLMIRAPGVEPRVVEGPVALFDLMPTILNFANLGLRSDVPARSLVPQMNGEPTDPDRLIFSELMPDGLYPHDQKSLRRGDLKLIYWTREGTHQLFDLANDPGERNDLSDERTEDAEEMLGILRAWMAQTHRPQNRTADVIAENRLSAVPDDMQNTVDAQFPGMFTILGYDVPRRRFRPGERITVDLYYRVDAQIDSDLFFYLNVEGPGGYRVPPHFHAHHYPLNGRYRTTEWRPGEILRDHVEMVIPTEIRRPVELTLRLLVLDDGRPLEFSAASGRSARLSLGTVDIR